MKKIMAMILLIGVLMSGSVFGTNAQIADDTLSEKYYEYYIKDDSYSPEKVEIWDSKEINGVVVFSGWIVGGIAPIDGWEIILGDWVVANTGYFSTGNGICMHVYDGEKFYTIKEAWQEGVVSDLSEYEDFSEPLFVTKIGDVNRDKEVNVKDATALQKVLAGIEVTSLEESYVNNGDFYVRDFNGDKSINVKDATAIQKRVAGMA